MTVFTVRVLTSPQSRTEILRSFTGILGLTRAQAGCISCRLYSDIEEPKAVLLREEWLSDDDLSRSLRSEDFKRILAAIELSSGPPELYIDQIATRGGMEVIESVRI
jgi:quinol monooxygenase YgiN